MSNETITFKRLLKYFPHYNFAKIRNILERDKKNV